MSMTAALDKLKALLRRPRADHLVVTVYSRQGCTCCETAMAVLRPRQQAHGFRLDVVDVDTDPALVALYGESVPVVAVDGKVRFRGKVNEVLLDRLLDAEAR